ncbi:protein INCA1 isoform X1 [Macaca thibetana thibetana]|uniref:protein INCA1 isoform X1 n=2 Tax=Macaca thibetana thibetana TaxID=257877 RepID=UPI0021BCDEFB|nr:protein INCA1 isoform X1 [Macaca thibetana thibetana]
MNDFFSIILPAPKRKLATQPSPVMQVQDDGGNLIPFAKCSRVVSRSPPPRLPSQSLRLMPQRYGDVFWKNLSQRPSLTWLEEQHIPPMLRATGCSQLGLYPPEQLPPPEMLWRRKKRRPCLERMQQQGLGGVPARVRAVTYHLEDLRRRQSIINDCFGLPGVPWVRRRLVPPGSCTLWPPSALSQPGGTPFTIPGGCSWQRLKSKEKPLMPRYWWCPRNPRLVPSLESPPLLT